METSFWLERWEKNEIAFHNENVNRFLAAHFGKLDLTASSRIFLPLCGKTRDIAWLLSEGHKVVGAELSEIAITQLFEDLQITPQIAPDGPFKRYSAPDIDIYVGDIFDLTPALLGPVHAIYDRAALIALPEDLRARYAAHLVALTERAQQFLIALEYDQSVMNGPPFSVDGPAVKQLYEAHYDVHHLMSAEVPGQLKGKVDAEDVVWLLR